jgi:glucans biosynthesis protein C
MLYSIAYMIGVWCWIFGLIGASLRFLSNESPLRRYIADSSYWMYLLHVPLLMFVHSLLQATEWHWSIEYTLSIVFVMPILLLTYHYWVRSTFIGATLNGKRYPKAKVESAAMLAS